MDDISATVHQNGIVEISTKYKFLKYIQNVFRIYGKKDHVYPVNFNGTSLDENSPIGSMRICVNSNHLALFLSVIVSKVGLVDMISSGETFVQVSKYFRMMQYMKNGEHAPHYDSDFYFPDKKHVTRYSLVMYMTDNETGEIVFCNDPVPGNASDWNRQATDDEIYLKIKPRQGKIVLFPHTLCHSVLPFTEENSNRVIIRGDLIYRMV